MTDIGPVCGRKAIEKYFVDLFQKWRVSNHISKHDQYSPHIVGTAGNETWATGAYGMRLFKARATVLYNTRATGQVIREVDDWKIQKLALERNPSTGCDTVANDHPEHNSIA